MLDSETYYFINYFYVFDAISAKDGSKCSYLQVLKTYIYRIELLHEMANLQIDEHVIQTSLL